MDNESDTGATSDTIKIDSYTMLSIAAASAFILDAIIDFSRSAYITDTPIRKYIPFGMKISKLMYVITAIF